MFEYWATGEPTFTRMVWFLLEILLKFELVKFNPQAYTGAFVLAMAVPLDLNTLFLITTEVPVVEVNCEKNA